MHQRGHKVSPDFGVGAGEFLEGELGSSLAGAFFRVALGTAGVVFADTDFDGECLRMLGALLLDNGVARRGEFELLGVFLERAFEVAYRGFAVGSVVGESLDDMSVDEVAGDFESAVKVESGNQGLVGVGEKSPLGTASAHLFAAAETEIAAEMKHFGGFVQPLGTDEVGFAFGKTAFGQTGIEGDKLLSDEESEDGIAEEFQLLVIAKNARSGYRAFEAIGLVSERAL